MTVVRSKCQGVQLHGDHMFWGTKIVGPADSEVTAGGSPCPALAVPVSPATLLRLHDLLAVSECRDAVAGELSGIFIAVCFHDVLRTTWVP